MIWLVGCRKITVLRALLVHSIIWLVQWTKNSRAARSARTLGKLIRLLGISFCRNYPQFIDSKRQLFNLCTVVDLHYHLRWWTKFSCNRKLRKKKNLLNEILCDILFHFSFRRIWEWRMTSCPCLVVWERFLVVVRTVCSANWFTPGEASTRL